MLWETKDNGNFRGRQINPQSGIQNSAHPRSPRVGWRMETVWESCGTAIPRVAVENLAQAIPGEPAGEREGISDVSGMEA